MIYISAKNLQKIIAQAQSELPNECCGLLSGLTNQDFTEIIEVHPMNNIDQSPQHFSLDPQEQFDVMYKARDKGFQILGNYHSHPTDPARPSKEDIRLAYDPNALYLIISLLEPTNPVCQAYRIVNGVVTEIPLKIK